MTPSPHSDSYERPGCRHRCGRAAAWGQPCAEGPNPDGSCPQSDRPCVPRPTLRVRRGRITLWTSLVTALLLAIGFHFGFKGATRPPAADAGPLSVSHAAFTADKGCAACHANHDQGLAALIGSVATPHRFNAECSTCHRFGGPADTPHNAGFTATRGPGTTDCRQCHTEHRGVTADLTTLTGDQCQTCHKETFHRFDLDHPAFPASFPRLVSATVKFNHASHLKDHFQKPEYASLPAVDCRTCHLASKDRTGLETAGFETACARCHAEQIRQTELTLLRLPDPETAAAELDPVDATPFMRARLGPDKPAPDYGPALRRYLEELAQAGPKVLPSPNVDATNHAVMVAGLGPNLLSVALKPWLKREAPELSPDAPVSGWYWFDDLTPEFRYKPTGHADPVVRGWIEGTAPRDENEFRRELRHPQNGPGRCAKCHAVEAATVTWTYPEHLHRDHTRFSHGTHLGLASCTDCHALDPTGDFDRQFTEASSPTTSNFKPIAVASCTLCHAENKVRHDCRLCHRYHAEPMSRIHRTSDGHEAGGDVARLLESR